MIQFGRKRDETITLRIHVISFTSTFFLRSHKVNREIFLTAQKKNDFRDV